MATGGQTRSAFGGGNNSSSSNLPASLNKAEFKKEKETQLSNIQSEIKKYDLEEMKTDVAHKVATIVNNLRKSER